MKRILAVLMTTAIMVAMMAIPASAALINLVAVDVVDVNNNQVVAQVQVPIGVAANICDVNAAVLVQEFRDTGSADCDAEVNNAAEANALLQRVPAPFQN